MGKPNKDKKKREQKRLAEKKDPALQAKRNAEKQEQFNKNIKGILRFTAKALLPAVFAILLFGLIFKSLPTSPNNAAFCAVGFIGAAIFGAGISLFIYGKRAYKIIVTIGIALAALSCLLMSKAGLTGEYSVPFYYCNISLTAIHLIFYWLFRFSVESWLRGRKISMTMIRKSKKGAKNFWWYEELHRNFGLSSIYTLNKVYTVFFSLYFTASVLFGWAEPLFRIFAVSFTLLALLTFYMGEFTRVQDTVEKYGCKFVLFKWDKYRKTMDSSLFYILFNLLPMLCAVCLWIMINDM